MMATENVMGYETMPLYKYQACPVDDQEKMGWVRQILVDHQFFFASRRSFNDPFDCVIPSFSQIPGTIVKRFVEGFVDRKFPDAAEVEKAGMMSKTYASYSRRR
jgi:hypothetical protein